MTKKKNSRKFRKEKYIKVSSYKDSTYFIVSFQYDTPTGKQTYTKQFNSSDYASPVEALNAACAHRDKKRAEMAAGTLVGRSTRTVADVWEAYCRTHPMPESTYKAESSRYRKIEAEFGNRPMQSITSLDITRQLESIKSDCTDEIIRRMAGLWKKIIQQAKLEGLITRDPMDMVILPASTKRTKVREKVCDDLTVDRAIDALRTQGTYFPSQRYLYDTLIRVIQVMRNTGMRPGEVYALTEESLDFYHKLIHVDSRLGVDEKGRTVVKKAKTESSIRAVPMNADCEHVLKEAVKEKRGQFIFSYANGKPLDTHEISTILNTVMRIHGVKFNLYMLRHNVASELITNHVDPRTVMEILGHKSAGMTLEVYSRSTAQNRQEALDLVGIGRKMS